MTTPPADETDRREVAEYEALAERAYDEMYDSRSPAACYSDLKDHCSQAIADANRAGLHSEAERLIKRLDHCKQVYAASFRVLERPRASATMRIFVDYISHQLYMLATVDSGRHAV